MTNEQNIIAVPVPVDAHDIKCNYQQVGYDTPSSTQIEVVNITTGLTPETNMQFLGCVSFKDGVYQAEGFDPSDYIETMYWRDPIDGFVARLQSMGHYWVNPLGEEPEEIPYEQFERNHNSCSSYSPSELYNDQCVMIDAWRAAQEKCLREDQKLAVMKIGG